MKKKFRSIYRIFLGKPKKKRNETRKVKLVNIFFPRMKKNDKEKGEESRKKNE